MRRRGRGGWLRRGLALLLVVALAAAAGLHWALRASRPLRSGVLIVRGIEEPIEIRFDDRASPYVRAATFGDALFAEGFLHVRERLWQMELLRRAGRGRLAEAFGVALLDTDRELWRAGVPQLALRLEANAGVETRQRIERYVSGINAALETLPVRPPALLLAQVAIRPWEPRDVYALGALTAFDSARNAETELLRLALAQALAPEEFAVFVPDESQIPGFPYVVGRHNTLEALARLDALDATDRALLPSAALGSNGWVVAPSRSRSRRALFAFDSHDALAMPNLLYEVHLFFDGDRQVRGWSVPGLPGVVNGFTARLAWGFTNIGDTQDLFLEIRDPKDPQRFREAAGWYRARLETVEIPVRGRDDAETLHIFYTRHGPLLSEDPPISLAWTAHRLGELGIDALFELNLATDWESFRAALDRFAAPSANVTYADVDGHIAVRTVGLLPQRGRGEGLLPQRGDQSESAWRGMVRMDELPQRLDPPRGFAAAANARVQPAEKSPLVSADNAPGYRMDRITSVLAGSSSHRPEGMRDLQMDWRNAQAERLLPTLLKALAGEKLRGSAAEAHALLQDWREQPLNAPARGAALLFERWYLELAEAVFAERLGDDLWRRLLRQNYVLNHALDALILGAGDSPWWRGDRSSMVRNGFLAAVAALVAELGKAPGAWRLDASQAVHLEHELGKALPLLGRWLDRGPFPWGGGHATVGRASYRYDQPGILNRGATVRVVAEMTTPMRVWAVIPGGQSGHPLDAHYDDQVESWLRGEQVALAARFEEASGSTLKLRPAVAP